MKRVYNKIFAILLILLFIPNVITYAINNGNLEEKLDITITGSLGSGKSTVGKILSEKLKFKIISAGNIMRNLSNKYKMDINDFSLYIKDKPNFDLELDEELKNTSSSNQGVIFDSRIAWHLLPKSFKIFLYVDETTSANRIYNDKNRTNENYESLIDAQKRIKERSLNTINRLNKLYGVDILNKENYDLYLDTSNLTIEEVTDVILNKYKDFCKKQQCKSKIISKIVLTGGPCAGKTESIKYLKQKLENQGKKVIIANETSSEIILSGFKWWDNSVPTNVYQDMIFKYQLYKENAILKTIENSNMDNVVVIFDRGLLDGKAYMDENDYIDMIKKYNLTEENLYDRYDTVLYLQSVALSIPEKFEYNNKARTATLSQAKLFDEKVKQVWKKHKNFIEIKACPKFEEKCENILNVIKNNL